MMQVGKVIELWRYPVSSVGGEQIGALEASPDGVPRERDFGIVDAQTGAVADPGREERWRAALTVRARINGDGETELCTPASAWMSAMNLNLRSALADHFGFPVEIRPYADRHSAPAGYDGPFAGNRYQPSALHMLTTASITELKRLHPDGNPDRRRFRPNMVVEMDAMEGSFPETEWLGRALRVGDLTMQVTDPTRRCGLTVLGQDDLPYDPEILRQLVRKNDRNIGVYCQPDRIGVIKAGDAVHLL